ncbi:Asparaginyl-tRNA synthetase [Chamberlinius hualienensis]
MAAFLKRSLAKNLNNSRRLLLLSNSFLRCCSTKKVLIKDLYHSDYIDKKISVKGWVRSMRKQKENLFMDVQDGSTFKKLQVIMPSKQAPSELSYGCSVELYGTLIRSTHPAQPFELKPDEVHVSGRCDITKYPLYAKQHLTMDHIRPFLHLRPRTRVFGHILRIRSAATLAVHEVFEKLDFIHINTPIITSNDCEGAGEVFTVQSKDASSDSSVTENKSILYFDKEVYLSVSGQFHLEAMASALTNVYTIGPTFRAENSRTRHHLSEFYMVEAEMAYLSNLEELMDFIELFIKSLIKKILEKCSEDVHELHKHLGVLDFNSDGFVETRYKRLAYTDAIEVLKNETGVAPLKWGDDLSKVHEKKLIEVMGNVPIFITNYPANLKPFYMKTSDSNCETVEAVDLLFPDVGELCGGSLREHRLRELQTKIAHMGLTESLKWYLDLRSFATCPHGGFGMGFERLLQSILKITNIRDTIPFPRWTHHCML